MLRSGSTEFPAKRFPLAPLYPGTRKLAKNWEPLPIATDIEIEQKNPVQGWRSVLWAVAGLGFGMGLLAYFIPPSQWIVAVRQVPPYHFLWATLFFLVACLAISQRWRACLSYRASFAEAFHSLGVAMAANLLIPSRSGEPLRVYLMAGRGVPAEFGTSAVVQERLTDQIFRILFALAALLIGGLGASQGANPRIFGVVSFTAILFACIGLLVRYRVVTARFSGRWLGKLPRLTPELVERFVRDTLADLSQILTRVGGKQAVVWGLLSWLLFTVHNLFILSAFFGPDCLSLALIAMTFGTQTSSAKPGYYHALLVASLMIFSADKTLALRAAVVLHLYQTVIFTPWGIMSWQAMKSMGPSVTLRTGEDCGQKEPGQPASEMAPVVDPGVS